MDAETFKALILSRYDDMYRMAYAIVQDSDDAQDAVQETVAILWARKGELDRVDSPGAFCMTALRHRAIDILRERSRRAAPPPLPDDGDLPRADNPYVRLEDADTLDFAERLIDRLPPAQQEVIRLRSHGGCSIDEIAGITGHTPANVRQLLSRARRYLRNILMNK